jgi:hypothetical protein
MTRPSKMRPRLSGVHFQEQRGNAQRLSWFQSALSGEAGNPDSNLSARALAMPAQIAGDSRIAIERIWRIALVAQRLDRFVNRVQAERTNGVLPMTMVPSPAVPFISVK